MTSSIVQIFGWLVQSRMLKIQEKRLVYHMQWAKSKVGKSHFNPAPLPNPTIECVKQVLSRLPA